MFCGLSLFDSLFTHAHTQPAVTAAAATIVATAPVFPVASRLDAALQAVAPALSASERAAWVKVLAVSTAQAMLNTPRRLAAFLGQCAVETGGFRVFEEDLNYSAERLCQVWPTRFANVAQADACAMQPEKLANIVYADRMGNGDAASGDGWTFRGRGLIQITGRTQYQQFARAVLMTPDQVVAYLATPKGQADSACWFWSTNDLNPLAEAWQLSEITQRINGGQEGAADRSRLSEAALNVFGAS